MVGPKDVGVVEALSGPAGCGGVESACHVSLICSRKVAWGSGNKVNTGASSANFGVLSVGSIHRIVSLVEKEKKE